MTGFGHVAPALSAIVLLCAIHWAGAVPVKPFHDPSIPGCITKGAPIDAPGVINVHIIPHTHDDVGWLKTVDQYYYGANNSIHHAGVQYILDTVVEQCMLNPDRKFTYVEQAFFQRWWAEQTPLMKEKVRGLVTRGQLQFINGGWSMHDEACTHYVSMIENTALGHRFLKDQFDYVPTVGWQIDPFGHSGVQAALLSAEVGFDSLYFARIDWQEAQLRTNEQNMEFMWRGSPSLGADAQVFTKVFFDQQYCPPDGLCFDANGWCDGGFPIMDDACMENENVGWYIDLVVSTAQKYANRTRGDLKTGAKDVMFLMGSDFQYENADMWYKNLDKLIHYVNKDGRVNLFYSTPIEYTAAKMKERMTWSVKEDDFMPLANDAHSYWTGFFTSRPCLKRYERVQAGYLQGARQMQMLADLPVNKYVTAAMQKGSPWYAKWYGIDRHDMDPLAAAVALNQHHDAITGTEKQHVAYDYAYRLSAGGAVADLAVNEAFGILTKAPATASFVQCKLLNESVCEVTHAASLSGTPFTISAYNPLGAPRVAHLRVPVGSGKLGVFDAATGAIIPSEVYAVAPLASPDQALQNQNHSSPFELRFRTVLPPLGVKSFWVRPVNKSQEVHYGAEPEPAVKDSAIVIGNQFVDVGFNAKTGLMQYMKNKEENVSVSMVQNFLWYESAQGADTQRSGAYIFRPNHTDPTGTKGINCVDKTCAAKITVLKTALCQEVRQVFSPWVTQTVRVWAQSRHVELEWTVGPVPYLDGLGKEIITRFTTNISSARKLYTDSNGRDMLERVRCVGDPKTNLDATCKQNVPGYNVTEPVAGNYYPVNTQVMIKDVNASLTVLVDRAQGTASLADGTLEVMLHRRLLADDNRGVEEPLNETQSISPYFWKDAEGKTHRDPYRIGKGLVARGKHTVTLTSPGKAARRYRHVQDEIYFAPVYSYAVGETWTTPEYSGLRAGLPPNVMLLTMEKQPDSSVLIRVAHRYGVGEDPELSVDTTVSLATLFKAAHLAKPLAVTEMSLTANQKKLDMLERRKNFEPVGSTGHVRAASKKAKGYTAGVLHSEPPQGPGMTIALAPLQIRTFLLSYK